MGISEGVFRQVNTGDSAYAVINISIQWTFNPGLYNIDHMARISLAMIIDHLKKHRE